jgi:hypothetical protein
VDAAKVHCTITGLQQEKHPLSSTFFYMQMQALCAPNYNPTTIHQALFPYCQNCDPSLLILLPHIVAPAAHLLVRPGATFRLVPLQPTCARAPVPPVEPILLLLFLMSPTIPRLAVILC